MTSSARSSSPKRGEETKNKKKIEIIIENETEWSPMRSCSTNVDRKTPFADLKYESRIHSLHTAAASTSTSKLGLFLHSLQSKRPCECLLRCAVFVARSSCVRSLSVVRSLFFARRATRKKNSEQILNVSEIYRKPSHTDTQTDKCGCWRLAMFFIVAAAQRNDCRSAATNRSANVKLWRNKITNYNGSTQLFSFSFVSVPHNRLLSFTFSLLLLLTEADVYAHA